jgi:hypothetical protein
MKYVILRSTAGPVAKKRGIRGSGAGMAASAKVEVGDLEPRLAATLAQKKFIVAMALNGKLLEGRLIGTATTAGMKSGFTAQDIGAGLVQASQN